MPTEPMWFDKPLSSLLLNGETLAIVKDGSDIHHEVELGVVIGMRGKDIKRENAMKHIHGYFVGIDFTNRTL